MRKALSFRWLYDHFEELLSVSCMGAMVLCLVVQVGMRWATGAGVPWSEELSRYTFLWATFSAAPMVAKHAAHVRISAQFLLFPMQYRLGFRIACDAVWIVFNLLIAWWSWNVIQSGIEFPELSPTLGIVRAYVEMIIPLSFIAMSWRIVENYLIRWREGSLTELVKQEVEQPTQ